MSGAAKRVATSSVKWAELSEKLTASHAADLTKLKALNTTASSVVNALPADVPKIDFAALKKSMPAYSSVLETLQKQYEALVIPYGTVPEQYNTQIKAWSDYNEKRIKFQDLKHASGVKEASKIEEKWAKAPPVEHFDRQMFVEYFPQLFYDLRFENRFPDPCNIGLNEQPQIEQRFKNYQVLRRPDKVDDH
uniref:ATP synthase subunit d, mitochondrial n=1 Tax=Rhabditophanes sp. KR3021 TaxID=114890 RepID=A0AC35TSM2_9BILA